MAKIKGRSVLAITVNRVAREIAAEDIALFAGQETPLLPETIVGDGERDTILADALGLMKERLRRLLELRYGLSGEREHTLEEVGFELNLSRERVRQLEARALNDLNSIMLKLGVTAEAVGFLGFQ